MSLHAKAAFVPVCGSLISMAWLPARESMRQPVDACDKGTSGIRQPYKQVPYKPEMPSPSLDALTVNVQIPTDIVISKQWTDVFPN